GLFAALTELRMPVRGWWIGSSTAFLGVAFLVGARFGFGGSDDSLDGDLLCLAAAICGSAGYIAGSRLTSETGTWATTFWGLTIAGLFLGRIRRIGRPSRVSATPHSSTLRFADRFWDT
ncbi:MAG: hypothetical protein VXX79_11860, partial [Pseudomonadota bacterium]|nr:hypothetical protein [Pseudomonadota bacterium]